MREIYNITIKLSSMRYEKPINDKEVNTSPTKEEQTKRWLEHFTKLLNRSLPRDIQQKIHSPRKLFT